MALYQIVKTPGKEVVYPLPDNEAHHPIRNQDEAKVIVQQLRAQLKKEGGTGDFVVQPIKDANGTPRPGVGGQQATSVRLTEEVRLELAKITGRLMMETGRTFTMSDAVYHLTKHFQRTADQFVFEIPVEEDATPIPEGPIEVVKPEADPPKTKKDKQSRDGSSKKGKKHAKSA